MSRTESYALLNAVVCDKLGHILARVLEKMAAHESEVFTSSEKDQLKSMLGIDDAQIDKVIDIAKKVFRDAATFGQIDRNLLLSRGVDDNVVSTMEKTWKKKGITVAKQIEASEAIEEPSLVLQKTDWRLHLQMGSSRRSGQSQPTAIFQFKVTNKSSSADETERLDVELSHAELRALFLQLNDIQAELDALPTPSVA